MDLTKVKIKKVHPDAKAPFYATAESAGCDIYSIEEFTLEPGETKKIGSGLKFEIPAGYYLRIEDRSGLALKGIHHVAGIIDSDYRGEVSIVLHNGSPEAYKIEKGDRIAQGILTPVNRAIFEEVQELSETERGEGGFHSTGKQ